MALPELPELDANLPAEENMRTGRIIEELNALSRIALPPERASAVIVCADRIIGRGYCTRLSYDERRQAHSPKQTLEKQLALPRALHAEIMAIVDMVRSSNIPEEFSRCIVYCSLAPCAGCAQALSLLRVGRVVYLDEFENNLGLLILEAAGIRCDIPKSLPPPLLSHKVSQT
jgi:deoxycytidylate deaminase